MTIGKKIIAAAVISSAAFGISSNASAHSGAAIAAIAVGGLILGSALATAPQPAPVVYRTPVQYAPQPVYYASPAYYPAAPVYYRHDYRYRYPHHRYQSR